MREILFLILFFYLIINCSNKEGFYNSFYNKLANIHQTNLNTDNKYPDRTIFYPVANHVKVKLGDKVKIEKGYVKSFRDVLQLSTGKYGKLTVL